LKETEQDFETSKTAALCALSVRCY